MAVVDQLLRPTELLMKKSIPEVTVASCMDEYLPIYTFPKHQIPKERPKLARVDSFPVVPDCFGECEALIPHGRIKIDCLDDGGFNGLPVDPTNCPGHGAQYDAPAETVSFTTYDARFPLMDGTGNPVKLLALSAPCANTTIGFGPAASGRAQPRRYPSDVCCPDLACFVADDSCSSGNHQVVPERSLLETSLLGMWEDRADRGLFRYDVTQFPTRVLPGSHGFILQLNEGRATKKRPTELTVDQVLQPFDRAKFNFTKAAISEVLVAFLPNDKGSRLPELLPPVAPLRGARGVEVPNLVLINISPIDYGHVLLVPRVLDNLPQSLNSEMVLLALQFAYQLDSPDFRVGYNSLGAFATINHLHFQSYRLSKPMPCEVATTVPLPGGLAAPPMPCSDADYAVISAPSAAAAAAAPLHLPSRKRPLDVKTLLQRPIAPVRVSRLQGYPVNAFVMEVTEDFTCRDGDGMEVMAAVVGTAAERLQAANQPFNLLITDRGRRVFLFPQCFAERQAAGAVPAELLATGVNPAAFEIAGHLLLKRTQDFEEATEEVAIRLLAQASLSEERFLAVANMCFGRSC
ncbi:hypothetical protein VaNZ11_009380 [Volvox africanus]|uniref:GDP-D-glucose phosphorylase 1 n=1 Tax=Volvox africanus TaxID=51714 RepID=A0ABQ5S863_9CHLO|nr:hypothetical protein VaNZ11_009380 [Volvox africanus]